MNIEKTLNDYLTLGMFPRVTGWMKTNQAVNCDTCDVLCVVSYIDVWHFGPY